MTCCDDNAICRYSNVTHIKSNLVLVPRSVFNLTKYLKMHKQNVCFIGFVNDWFDFSMKL
jgi:hypothetical protein